MKEIFISYSSKDIKEVSKVAKMLDDSHITYFMAPSGIPAGSNYAKEIPRAIKECTVFVLFVSENSQESVWVEKEIDLAVNSRKVIVPLLISDTKLNDLFLFYLNNVQMIKYYENPQVGLRQLGLRLSMLLRGNEIEEADDKNKKASEEQKESLQTAQQPVLTAVEKEILAMQEKKKQSGRVVRYMDESNLMMGKLPPNMSRRDINKKSAEENRSSYRAGAMKNNMTSVNKMPLECEICGGDLAQVHVGTYKCVSCGYLNYDSFQKIRNFLAEHGAGNVYEISNATGVSRKVVEYFLLEEKLEITESSSVRLMCQKCGALIKSGRLCDKCKQSEDKYGYKKIIH